MSRNILIKILTGVIGALIAGILLFYFTVKMNQFKLENKIR